MPTIIVQEATTFRKRTAGAPESVPDVTKPVVVPANKPTLVEQWVVDTPEFHKLVNEKNARIAT